jgi:hypothetical protein
MMYMFSFAQKFKSHILWDTKRVKMTNFVKKCTHALVQKGKKPVGENALCNGISDAAKRFCKSTHSTQRAESFTLTFLSTPAHKAPNGFGWYEFFPTPKLSTILPSNARNNPM